MEGTHPLHLCHVNKSSSIFNRIHALFLTLSLISLFYYRANFLYPNSQIGKVPTLPYLIVVFSEVFLSIIWFFGQAFRWQPVSRTAFPEMLPLDDQLPAIDVFICTADPDKEPTLEVMNTVISAMAIDYPPDKLFVYLSDDGYSSATLNAMHKALSFAKWWILYCKNYGIKTRCPSAHFMGYDQDETIRGDSSLDTDFLADRKKIKGKYDKFKNRLETIKGQAIQGDKRDHSTFVEVINNKNAPPDDGRAMPNLVYLSREKRTSHAHHFKAGALNSLLRVSALISNSPYILVLDCDMYCNDPASARQAMCFHLDPVLSSSLAFVQFPQKFHNICENDIYDSQMRSCFTTFWRGMDGLQGPCLSGTGFYMKRLALYGKPKYGLDEITNLKHSFGSSNQFIKSLDQRHIPDGRELREAEYVASCAYEDQTQWGKEVSNHYFIIIPFIFVVSNLKQIEEICSSGCSNYVQTWVNEMRTWMMYGVSYQTFGCADVVMEKLGFGEVSFLPTNKVVDEEQTKLYQMGKFDFQISPTLLVPMVSIVVLNIASLIGGLIRAVLIDNLDEMCLQICLSFFIVVVNYPIIEGMVTRKDKGRIPSFVTVKCVVISMIFMLFGALVLNNT